jgi:type I restriction enzyme M protein
MGRVNMNFSEAKLKFDTEYKDKTYLKKSLVTVDGKFVENIKIKDVNNQPNRSITNGNLFIQL